MKIDLLGNRSLAVLRDTLELVERNHAVRLEWESFDPLSDPDTRDLIAGGKTLGVFYVESPATRQLLTKMQKGDYENLVIASSIIRPAANQYIRTFVKRLHGAPYRPLHPLIEKTLAETFGVMVYQEDVSRVAIDLAGFPIEEADRLRKILSKKDRDLKLPDFREKFFRGARARGVREETDREGLGHDPLLRRLLLLQGAQRLLCPGLLPGRVPQALLPAGVHRLGHQQRRRLLRPADLRGRVPAHGLPHPAAGREQEQVGVHGGGRRQRGGWACAWAWASSRTRGRSSWRPSSRSASGEGRSRGFRDFLQRAPCRFEDIRVLIRSGALDSVSDGYTRPQLFFRWLNMEKEEGLGFLPPAPPLIGDYPSAGQARRRGEDPRHRGLPTSAGALPSADREDREASRPFALHRLLRHPGVQRAEGVDRRASS